LSVQRQAGSKLHRVELAEDVRAQGLYTRDEPRAEHGMRKVGHRFVEVRDRITLRDLAVPEADSGAAIG